MYVEDFILVLITGHWNLIWSTVEQVHESSGQNASLI